MAAPAGPASVRQDDRREASATAEVYDPATGQFTPSARLTMPRVGHAAIRLPDGRVLLVGGWSGQQETAAAELYDPATGTFVPAGALVTPRAGASVTALADGSVLIAGGVLKRQVLASAERYDPRTGRFTPTGALGEPRTAHAAARLADGRVLVTGGSRAPGAVVASAEVYDPVTERFTPTGAMTVARHKHAATALGDGTVLIAGGSDARDFQGRYASAERFGPRTGRFTPTASMAAARFKIPDATALLPTGEVLIGGGAARVERFDPVSGGFHQGGELDAPRAFSTATLLPGGAVLLVGGYDLRLQVTAGAWLVRRQPAA